MKDTCSCENCECEKEKVVKVYFCPKCQSKEVGYVFGIRNLFGVIPKMECKKCGLRANIFPQLVVNYEKLQKQNKKLNSRKKKR